MVLDEVEHGASSGLDVEDENLNEEDEAGHASKRAPRERGDGDAAEHDHGVCEMERVEAHGMGGVGTSKHHEAGGQALRHRGGLLGPTWAKCSGPCRGDRPALTQASSNGCSVSLSGRRKKSPQKNLEP